MSEAREPTANASPPPTESIEVDEPNKDGERDEGNEDAAEDGDPMDTSGDGAGITSEQYKALRNICEIVQTHKIKLRGDEEYYPSILFRRIPNKRNLPDYYEIIKEPVAISTLKHRIQAKKYSRIPEVVRDFALIVHNAQVYNRPNSQPVRDVLVLKEVFDEEIKKLVDEGLIKAEETAYPDLGPIPEATPEPDPISDDEEEEAEDEGEDDEDDEEADDSDEDHHRRRSRKVGRASLAGRKHGRDDEDDTGKGAEDARKRRGRPPRVDTPMEARIKAVLKGVRKPKDDDGNLMIRHFERQPDKQLFPEYYQAIKHPIALDTLKRKSKRKKYTSLDEFLKDLDLMFDNAMIYNEDDSDIFRHSLELKTEAHNLLDAEIAKPDEEYMMEDGRLPLPNGILYKNELWKIGDWIHVQNPNDVTKPIVAQIYRTWQDPEGQKWINACWYYRPEQTVHHYEKHFYPNEVVKTGQYRDHQIDEIVDRCFVMFFTRYSRGRPRDIGDKEVYVCEARYNEEKHKLNKIKTWASCLPDEVRDKDYEMDLFESARKIKKVPSPLSYLISDGKEHGDTAQAEWGLPSAPPRRGGIYKGPRDENQSPPPEPTPPPPPTPPPQPARPSLPAMLPNPSGRGSLDHQPNGGRRVPGISPSITPQLSQYQSATGAATPSLARHGSQTMAGIAYNYASGVPRTPGQTHNTPYEAAQHQLHAPPTLAAAHPIKYNPAASTSSYPRAQVPQSQPPQYPYAVGSQSSRTPDVFVLKDTANEAIPKEIRDQFPQDSAGRVLFFNTPPQYTRRFIEGRTIADKGKPLGHSSSYVEAKTKANPKSAKIDRFDNEAADVEMDDAIGGCAQDILRRADARPVQATDLATSIEKGLTAHTDALRAQASKLLGKTLKIWSQQMEEVNEELAENLYGKDWRQKMTEAQDENNLDASELAKRKAREEKERKRQAFMKTIVREPEYTTQIYKDPSNGLYLDDYDPRYGF